MSSVRGSRATLLRPFMFRVSNRLALPLPAERSGSGFSGERVSACDVWSHFQFLSSSSSHNDNTAGTAASPKMYP